MNKMGELAVDGERWGRCDACSVATVASDSIFPVSVSIYMDAVLN